MRRHTLPEPDYDENADGEMLARTLNLLLPIRRQRLSRSERQQREAEKALRALDAKTTEAEQQLRQKQHDYQQRRDAFATENCGKHQAKYRLERAIEQEQQAAGRVDAVRQTLQQLAQQRAAQAEQVALAQQETRQRQRDVEKLDYLLQQKEVFG